ncbi:hypothetical protein IT397_00670 [Candidatus Nomurabacteria bacterium]|nr:hypothetical protein [Candidatus Nomurabacteria bacterium]
MKKLVFDMERYQLKQIVEALTCPVNRHATRVEHNCGDEELFQHPEWLIQHFIREGGAKEFAKRREKFMKEIEVPTWTILVDNLKKSVRMFKKLIRLSLKARLRKLTRHHHTHH